MLSDINKLTRVMPFEKIKCLHSDLYNQPHANAYKCSENNITQKKKKWLYREDK